MMWSQFISQAEVMANQRVSPGGLASPEASVFAAHFPANIIRRSHPFSPASRSARISRRIAAIRSGLVRFRMQSLPGLCQLYDLHYDWTSFWGALQFVLRVSSNRSDALTKRCIELYKEVAALPPNAETSELSPRFYELEADYKRFRARLIMLPALFAIYGGSSLFVAAIHQINIVGFIKDVLRVDAPERLVTFGIAGAFLYLATSLLAHFNEKGAGASKDN